MRPLLKISQLISLQDARSSAAVGFDLISFSLERGSDRKLSPATAWNIVQWLSGPDIVLEINAQSWPELEELDAQFAYQYVSLPLDAWDGSLPRPLPGLILRAGPEADPAQLVDIASVTGATLPQLRFELSLASPADLAAFAPILSQSLVHFTQPEAAEAFLDEAVALPWGLAFGPEWEEEPGVLDYARIDAFMERFEARFPAE